MSSPDHKLSRTIFSFVIRWVEIKIFQFWDIGLEVERSQLVVLKISKWSFSHHFFSPPRTHSNLQNRIWMSITHSMIVRRFPSYKLEGRESQEDSLKITTCEKFMKAWVCKWERYELDFTSWCDSWLLELLNLLNMGWTTSNPCTVDEIATKTWKN